MTLFSGYGCTYFVFSDALKDTRPAGWCLSPTFLNEYLPLSEAEVQTWSPGPHYFLHLVGRLTRAVQGKGKPFPDLDARFTEFANPAAHALYATCIELMGLPGK